MNKRPISNWLGAAAVGFSVLCSLLNWPQLAAAAAQSRRSLADGSGHKVFMEYIGGGGAALSDVPVIDSSAFDFYFLLAFATDPSTTEGRFNATWQPRLSPDNIAAIKALHPNIKFSCSVGGGGGGATVTFQPTNVTTWIENAVASLSGIISEYHLDGIDIDFESFDSSSTDEFATGIGELITQLKQKNVISFATIAPYPSTDPYYTVLWRSYNKTIDYVNYQFYSQGSMLASEYVNTYTGVKSMYEGGTVLASFETVNNGTAIVPASGLDACEQLKERGELNGIFIWSADQSYKDFQYEKQAQTLLESAATPSPSPAPSQLAPSLSSPLGQPPLAASPLPESPNVPISHGSPTSFFSHKQYKLSLSIVVTLGFFL